MPDKLPLAWIILMAKNRKIYSWLGLALLLLGLCLFMASERGERSGSSSGSAKQGEGNGASADPSRSRSADRKRAEAGKPWKTAKELSPAGEPDEPGDSPLFLGYLKADDARTTLRVGFRQETRGEVDPDDYTVAVDLLDDAGEKLAADNETSVVWWTAEQNFEDNSTPMLEVKSANPVSGVELKLSYKGQEVERRKYALAEK
ncbi:hypothetical protein [Luteolibacter sp. Populi]|uniref:hypothetical protein n=1 Tax=Luteolibacter sp. Populi TaxID=3230487 RepID=UPI0034678F73